MSKSLKIQKKRRLENKTDYRARLAMLKSGMKRIVIRRTNKYIIAQAVESTEAQDKVISGVNSKNLIENGWNEKFAGSLKSVPAAYLTGMLMAKKLGKGKYIVDIGMARHGNRILAAVKGLIDGGLDVSADQKKFPSKERLNGDHMKKEVKDMIANIKEKLK